MSIHLTFDDLACAEGLAGMVRFQTVSNSDPDQMNFEEFYKFHKYLEKRYPLLHQSLKKEIIGRAGLLYTWKGKKSDKAPLMLIGHQDVVPAGDPKKWNYPPYDGVIADGRIWGRGANDCKSVLTGHMEAIEELLRQGFVPEMDVILGYGYNEEVGNVGNSAAMICEVLEKRGIRPGLLIDEGQGVMDGKKSGINGKVAYIKLGEKGFVDYQLQIHEKGGHAMAPGFSNPIAAMAEIILDLEKNPLPYRVIDEVAEEYRIKSAGMLENSELYRDICGNFEAVLPELKKNLRELSKFRTTLAMTMLSASDASNVLPSEVKLVINCRLLKGDTIESIRQYLEKIVNGRAEISILKGNEATDITGSESAGYGYMKDVIEEMYPGTLVVPTFSVGGTDAKYYAPICSCVCRFGGFPSDGYPINIHTYNENMPLNGFGKGPEFFARLIMHYGQEV